MVDLRVCLRMSVCIWLGNVFVDVDLGFRWVYLGNLLVDSAFYGLTYVCMYVCRRFWLGLGPRAIDLRNSN